MNTLHQQEEIIFCNFCVSATGINEPFWGVKLNIPVGIKGNIFIPTKDEKEIINIFLTHLNEISEPFPILLERIPKLNLHIHLIDTWEQTLLNCYNDNITIYLCDHKH